MKNTFNTIKAIICTVGTLLISVPIILLAVYMLPLLLFIGGGILIFCFFKIMFTETEEEDLPS